MSKIYPLLFIWLILGCGYNQESVLVFRDGKQLLSVNSINEFGEAIDSVEVLVIGSDTVKAGKSAKFRMLLKSKQFELLQAYFHCEINEKSYVDTLSKRIENCSNRLPIRNDTVIIEFTAGEPGHHKFLDLTLLTRDKNRIFRYHKATFEYLSVE